VKAATIGIRTLADYSVWLKDHQQTFWRCCWDSYARLIFSSRPSFIPRKISCSRIDMVCTHICSFLAPEGKYPEPAASSHLIEAEGYEIHPNSISLVREQNFA
jgi:hypothetical protein